MKIQDKFVNLQKNYAMTSVYKTKIGVTSFFLFSFLACFFFGNAVAIADEIEGVNPRVECEYTDSSGVIIVDTAAFGNTIYCEAPVLVRCTANLKYDKVKYPTCICEWKIFESEKGSSKPLIDRFTEDTEYTITANGSYGVRFYCKLIQADGTETPIEPDSATIAIKESELACPNGFSPNGDGTNDVFKMTKFQSIVSLEGEIYNRWGQKLHTFTLDNIREGWDGRYNGKVVKDGAYILRLHAKGSEGNEYNIRKVINVLKGYRESTEEK